MLARPLSEVEKTIALETLNNKRNGILSAVVFSSDQEEALREDDTATLASIRSYRVGSSLIKKALQLLVYENPELQVCINDDLKYEQIKTINYHDVLNKLDFDNVIDEKINCYHSIPLYLLREIFNKTKFELNKPLWRMFIVDENMLVFHGHESLFDNFSVMNLQKKLYNTIGTLQSKKNDQQQSGQVLFESKFAKHFDFPKSIFDSSKLYLPAVAKDLLQLQTQSFFKNVYLQTIKKPIDFFNSTPQYEILNHKTSIVFNFNDLCGNTVFGNISPSQFQNLKKALELENITLKTFMASLSMMCLQPFTASMNKDDFISFCFPIDLRKDLLYYEKDNASLGGLVYKKIIVECPLAMISDSAYDNATFHNGYDPKNVKIPKADPKFAEKLFEYKFNQVAAHIQSSVDQRVKVWKRNKFNDDDFKRMKFGKKDAQEQKYFEINDLTDFKLEPKGGKTSEKYKPKEIFFVKSENPESFMSLSFTYCELSGMNICIQYPEGYNMDDYVSNFETLITRLVES